MEHNDPLPTFSYLIFYFEVGKRKCRFDLEYKTSETNVTLECLKAKNKKKSYRSSAGNMLLTALSCERRTKTQHALLVKTSRIFCSVVALSCIKVFMIILVPQICKQNRLTRNTLKNNAAIQGHCRKYILKLHAWHWVNTQTAEAELSTKPNSFNVKVFMAVLLRCLALHHIGVSVCYSSARSVLSRVMV